MGVLQRFFDNTRKPAGIGGRLMLSLMNAGHKANALWGLAHVQIPDDADVLDVGCGGGANMQQLLLRVPHGMICGVDYSPESVSASRHTNRAAIEQGRAKVVAGNVSELPLGDNTFDMVTAFETIYFWPDLFLDFAEIYRVLRENGLFLICNEAARPEKAEKWINLLNMRIYTGQELSRILMQIGFTEIACYEHPNGKWLCVIARKPGQPESPTGKTPQPC